MTGELNEITQKIKEKREVLKNLRAEAKIIREKLKTARNEIKTERENTKQKIKEIRAELKAKIATKREIKENEWMPKKAQIANERLALVRMRQEKRAMKKKKK